jgi:hypothetical protein
LKQGENKCVNIVEFYNTKFLQQNYIFREPEGAMKNYIEFYWQTNYLANEQFTVKTFPRLGSTVLFNLGSPFEIKKRVSEGEVNEPVYYLRDSPITSIHYPGNRIFGIQFKINLPVMLKNKCRADTGSIYYLNTFFEKELITAIQQQDDFMARIEKIERYLLNRLTTKHESKADTVNSILLDFMNHIEEVKTIGGLCNNNFCTIKTAERYFSECLGISPKKAISVLRSRKALNTYINNRDKFKPHLLGYYDNSHFHRELKEFTSF